MLGLLSNPDLDHGPILVSYDRAHVLREYASMLSKRLAVRLTAVLDSGASSFVYDDVYHTKYVLSIDVQPHSPNARA